MKPTTAEWIAVDWGTSNLRVWAMGADGKPVAEKTSDKGMGSLARDGFEPALLDLIDPWLKDGRVTPVLCCGMVGARQGWAEAVYLPVPSAPPDAQTATPVTARDKRLSVHILPGMSQTTPPDVMRGEETQIAGFLRDNPNFDGVLCLPGTHTKWVHISAGEIVSFQTFMTGELFALLSKQSVLRFSVESDAFDRAAFEAALDEAMARPHTMAAQLFGLRAGSLVADLDAAAARARLSGLLIGAELAAARAYWLGRDIAIIGADKMALLYQAGLAAQGLDAKLVDVTELTLSGLKAAYDSMKGKTA